MGCASSTQAGADARASASKAPVHRGQAQPTKFSAKYTLGKKLGAGGFGTVRQCHTHDGTDYAVKVMHLPKPLEKPANDGATYEEIMNEVEVLAKVDHPNCLEMIEWFAEDHKALIVTEVIRGTEVLEAMSNLGHYTEEDARVVIKQLISGIAYLHDNNILHRDLKLENLMLSHPGDITTGIKIVDFGLARIGGPFDEDDVCGTPMYVAPEVLGAPGPGGSRGAKAVTVAVDMWSIGVVMFMLLAGYPPFIAEPDSKLFSLIRRGKFVLAPSVFDTVTEEAKDLIRKLLVVHPDERIKASEALKHPWFACLNKNLTMNLKEAQKGLKKIMARRRFKGAVEGVVAVGRMRNILKAAQATAIEEEKAEAAAKAAAPAKK